MAYQLLIYNIIQYIYSLILKKCIKVLKNFLFLLLFCCSRTLKLNYSNQLSKIIHGTGKINLVQAGCIILGPWVITWAVPIQSVNKHCLSK